MGFIKQKMQEIMDSEAVLSLLYGNVDFTSTIYANKVILKGSISFRGWTEIKIHVRLLNYHDNSVL